MAAPLGFYAKHGLNVEVVKTAGWAVIRDKTINKEYDAAHMLAPMPIAISLGLGAQAIPFAVPAIENINGQAITLAMKHKDKRDPKDWKGLKFAIPFDYSMHNYLLRYYLAEHGLDPDTDVQIRSVPPPEMVANLRADNIDGFLAPDNICQRAVYDGVGFIHILSKEIWDGHPCCAFAASREFITTSPNTFAALTRAILDATAYASKAENRKQIAEAIAPANYLNPPVTVLEQVLTGTYADGLGGVKTDAKRVDFDPFPWQSFAVWMLTQMKRWGQIKGDVDYKAIAEQVYLATDTAQGDGGDGADAAGDVLQDVLGDGQDLRSGQARGLSQQLQDQEVVVRDQAASCFFPPSTILRVAGRVGVEDAGVGVLPRRTPPPRTAKSELRSSRPRRFAALRGRRGADKTMTSSLRLRAAIVSIALFLAFIGVWHIATPRHRRGRQHEPGIRQADGR